MGFSYSCAGVTILGVGAFHSLLPNVGLTTLSMITSVGSYVGSDDFDLSFLSPKNAALNLESVVDGLDPGVGTEAENNAAYKELILL